MNTEKVTFQTNIPVDLALKWTDGVNFNGQYGPGARFATIDGRTLLLPEPAANKLRALDLKPGQPFRAVKAELNGQGRKRVEWQFEKLGEQPNGTFVVPKAGAGERRLPQSYHVVRTPENSKPRIGRYLRRMSEACIAG